MKVITGIERQKNNSERYNIYLDNQYEFSCHLEIVKKLKLKEGLKLKDEKLKELIFENNLKEAFHQALSHLSYRQRTEQEMIIYLQKKGYDENVIKDTLIKLENYQFIDDEKYTQSYVGYKGKTQLKGSQRIRQELKHRGIDKEIIEAGLQQYTHEEELENCLKIAKRFFMTKKKFPLNQIKGKLSLKLAAKGYRWEMIQEAMAYLDRDDEIQEAVEAQEDNHMALAQGLAEKLLQRHQGKINNPYQLKMKIISGLRQKGFESQIIDLVLERLNLS